VATMKERLSRTGVLDKAGAEYLTRSLAFDANDCDVHVQLVAYRRRTGDLKKAREHLDAGLRLFPDSPALLNEAVETALTAGAFKKASIMAHRLLALDPLNRKVRTLLGNAHLSHAGKHIAAGKLAPAKVEIEEARSWLGAAAEQGRLQLLLAWTETAGSPERLRLAQLAATTWGGGLAAGWRLLREAQGIFSRVGLPSANWLLSEAGIDSAKPLTPADVLGLVQVLEQEAPVVRKGADPLVAWRKALTTLADAPVFDAEAMTRICEAWSDHKEHDLLEKFATAARKRWPDRPIFVYHAVAACFGKNGGIETDRDFDDLDTAQALARKNKDFKLGSRIEALFEADDPGPDFDDFGPDFDDSDLTDGTPMLSLQAIRAMLEETTKMDGGKSFLKEARDNLGDALIRQVEKACGGDKKAVLRRLIDLVAADVAGTFGQPLPPTAVKGKKPPPKPGKIDKPIAPAQGQGNLFDE
jgi:cellulose synthase operon protein C